MYGPAPHRPSKTGARRSKSGCVSCRKKRRKCDESKPRCNRCLSASIECSYNTRVEFRDATVWAAQKVKRRIIRDPKARSPTPPESQNRHWPCFQPSPPSECDIVNNNDIPASAGQVTDSPNNHVENNDVNQKQDTDLDGHVASDDIHKRQSDRGQTVQPAELTPSDRPMLGLASPSTDIDIAAWMPTGVISPSWDDYVSSDMLTGDMHQHMSDQGALDINLEPCYNEMWWSLVESPSRVEPDSTASIPSTSTFESAVGQEGRLDSVNSPSDAMTKTSVPILEQTIWTAPLPSSMPNIPVRDRVYLAHFMSQMIDLLPGQVKCLRKMAIQSEPIRLCANSVAAANLANRGGRLSNDEAGRWVPMQTHYSRALSFASRSMDAIQSSLNIFPGCRVVMLILMLCYQLELGCIGEIYHALSVLDSAIFSNRDVILSLEFGRGLVQCWLGLRALCEGTLQPLALFRGESQTEHVVSELQDLTTTTSQAFGIIAAKAYRISRRILLFRCMGDNERSPSTVASKFSQWWSIIKCQEADDITGTHDSGGHLSEDKLFCELARLRDALDISELPAGLPLNFDPSVPVPSTTPPEPLYLPDHEQAMELTDYASAQIFCDESSIQTLGSPTFQRSPSRNPWLHLLLRIAAGLDVEKCLTRNRYRQGICNSLQCAVFLLQDLAAANFLSDLLQRLMDAGGSYEDCFTPLSLLSQCNKLFCQELMRGRTVFMLCPTYNAWTSKDVLFSRGDHESFIIFGRDPNGLYLKDMVELEESLGNLDIL